MGAIDLLNVIGALAVLAPGDSAAGSGARVDFGRDVRPVLSQHCFACHGPDEGRRKAGLRLDLAEGATALLESGHRAIVPHDVAGSELVARITHESVKRRMPPRSADKPLSPDQVATLTRWIAEGAEYREHWSFLPPARPALPPPSAGARNEVDRFVLARLRAEGLEPEPEADRETLLRRVTLDLTGLPPAPAEIDAFVADRDPDAWEKVVRRLLASPRYGEQMARHWLDLARYGDTHGYHLDNERALWRWREWVIDAFNRNLPFDRFTIEQLAGDLLPEPDDAARIATGFLRCNPTTGEGGLIEEEYLVKYAVDRVNTAATVWLGLSVGCAQCHDHKFDPISQRDFYGMFAFFHSIAESGSDDNALAPAPAIQAPDPEQADALAALRARIAEEEARLDAPLPSVDAAQEEWERAWTARLAGRWQVLDPARATSSGGTTFTELEDGSLLAGGENPASDVDEIEFDDAPAVITALRLETLADPSLPLGGPGRYPNGNFVLTGFEAELAAADGGIRPIAFASAHEDHAQDDFPASNAIDGNAATGWAILPRLSSHQALFVAREAIERRADERLRVRLRFESVFAQHGAGRVRLSASGDPELTPCTLSPWRVLGPFHAEDGNAAHATPFGPEQAIAGGVDFGASWPDGRGGGLAWVERPDLADGATASFAGENAAVYLARTIESRGERTVNLALGSDDGLAVWLNGVRLLDRNVERSVAPRQELLAAGLRDGGNLLVVKVVNHRGAFAFHFEKAGEEPGGLPLRIAALLAGAPEAAGGAPRGDEARRALRDHFRRRHAPEWSAIQERVAALRAEQARLDASIPRTMVAMELAQPRPTRVLMRGQYDRPGEPVEAAIPPALGRLPEEAPRNRLGFARWLVARDQPLTARVAVNRLWLRLFGSGIVGTAQDFGAQGEWPSHPELLDWLAVEFMESGWDVKRLCELLVTSAAYRRSSAVTPALLARDRENRLLARAARFRLDAEEIRDVALCASGLLVERIGGRSVKPYQPGDLWKVVGYPTSSTASFVQDHGEALWRRSLYTFWKRTSPPANLTAFDAPSRESCTVERPRTNTPLQALVLMNDVQFVEAARVLAQRLLREAGPRAEERVTLAFRLLVGRRPTARELAICAAAAARELERFRADAGAARALLGQGEAPVDAALDPAELAAWTTLSSTLLNLDETISRG